MGMDRHSGSSRHRVNNHRYYKHLLLALLRRVDGLIVETYLRCTLRIIIVNLSSLRSRRMLLQLRSHLESSDYYGNQPLKKLIRELVQLKCDQDISNVIGRARFSEFLSKRELRNLGIDYAGTLEQRLLELSNQEQSEEELRTPFLEPIEPQLEQPASPQLISDTVSVQQSEIELIVTQQVFQPETLIDLSQTAYLFPPVELTEPLITFHSLSDSFLGNMNEQQQADPALQQQ